MAKRPKCRDKRTSPRTSAQMRANIVDLDQGIIGGCMVSDLSDLGARLELDSKIDLPEDLWLQLENDTALRYCAIKWREKQSLGVEFTLEKMIQDSEQQIQKLRRVVQWQKMDRRSGVDRRSGGGKRLNVAGRSTTRRRADASRTEKPAEPA